MRRLTAGAVLAVLCVLVAAAGAQEQPGDGGARSSGGGRVLLVLPFDNRTGQPSLEWMREAAAEILSMRFASAGFQPTSRADRVYALDHLGLPQGFQPSRASALKLAQTLDADSIVVGSYTTDGTSIVAQASLVDVPNLRMLPEVSARGEMNDLIAVFGALAWKLTRRARSLRSAWPRRRLSLRGVRSGWTRSSSTFAASRSRTRRSGSGTWNRR